MRAGSVVRATIAAAILTAAVAPVVDAGSPGPPGGRHGVYYGGDNTNGYPALALTDTGDDAAAGLGAWRVRTAPNPFHQRTEIQFAARHGEAVRVTLYATNGRVVREFVETSERTGWHTIAWDGRDQSGAALAAGVYFYRVASGPRSATGRLVFIR